jgi:succinylglutamate desuccinylase
LEKGVLPGLQSGAELEAADGRGLAEEPGAGSLSGLPRELGRIGDAAGPTVVCVGGLHGNEPAGVRAVQRVLSRLGRNASNLRGRLIGLAGNRMALAVGRRFMDRDLNRIWSSSNLDGARRSTAIDAEAAELLELNAAVEEILETAQDRIFMLDLHTTSGQGPPFAVLDDSLSNREIAFDFPVTLVLGLEEELSGTLASHFTARGVTVVGFEAGQHEDPESVQRAEAAVWIVLESCGVVVEAEWAEVSEARRLLRQERGSAPRIVEVRYRHPINGVDGFRMRAGFESFQIIRSSEVLAASGEGEVRALMDGRLLMPKYQELGDDGFFLVREVRPLWLVLSAGLRRLNVDRLLHWLPGIRRHPDLPEAFRVDRRYARWLARQLFHLLGYRRIGKAGRVLTMIRRRERLE